MKLIVLGSGTCVPSLTRNAPGYYLAAGGRRMLIDIGSTTLQQLVRAGIPYLEIDTIFITHTHPDHVSGLLPFMHALIATPGRTRTRELSIIGPSGLQTFYDRCITTIMKPPTTFTLTITEMGEHLALGSLLVESTPTAHTETSIGFRFIENNRSVVFTGDCDYDSSLIFFSKDADLLVIDCSFPNTMKKNGHLIPKECGLVAREAGVKKVLLTHIHPTDGPDTIRVDECKAVFSGQVLLAQDLMELDIE
jgi:ribonuclease BN (tRNA processing enzyme)